MSDDFIKHTRTLKVVRQSSMSKDFIGYTRTLELQDTPLYQKTM